MQSKMMRVAIPKRSDYQTVDLSKSRQLGPINPESLPEEERAKFEALDEYHQIIYPWKQNFSNANKRYYFYNEKTKESVWELPDDVRKLADRYYYAQSVQNFNLTKRNVDIFLNIREENEEESEEKVQRILDDMAEDKQNEDFALREELKESSDRDLDKISEHDEASQQIEESEVANPAILHHEGENDIDGIQVIPSDTQYENDEHLPNDYPNQFVEQGEEIPQLKVPLSYDLKQEPGEPTELKNFKTAWVTRPAPVQQDISFFQDHAYKEGDQEYNIWYDKYIEDEIIPQREGAKCKCNPSLHSGYTRADVFERSQRNFCIHFARGNCFLGVNCGFYHHVPSLTECLKVDNGKDIFGRSRFATHRKDNRGIGNFLKETRTLRLSDFSAPVNATNPVQATYEMLWRHFSQWGTVEDLFLIPSVNVAYIRFAHRCMAEFAKVAMTDQTLDADEILTVKWTDDDCFALDEAEHQELLDTIEQQKQKNMTKKEKQKKKGPKDANIGESEFDFDEKKKRQRLTMEEFYKEEEMNFQYQEKLRRQVVDPSRIQMEAQFTLFEQRLRQAELDKLKLDQSLKRVKTGNGSKGLYSYQQFLNDVKEEQREEKLF